MIRIRQEEVPVLVFPKEPSIYCSFQAIKTPTVQEFIADTAPYNTGANRTPWRFIRTGINGSIPSASGIVARVVTICTIPNPPYLCIWNGTIGNIRQTTTPNFRETSEFHTSIYRILSNDSNAWSLGSNILRD